MKKNKILVAFLIIFVVISLLLGGYIFYDKVLKNKSENPKNPETDKKDYVTDLINVKKEIKYNGTCLENTSFITANVSLPKINIDKPNAKKLNNQIENEFKDIIDESKKDETNKAFINSSYKSIVRDNIIYLDVERDLSIGCTSGGGFRKNYFYDIENDKILSMEEGFKEAGYSLDDLQMAAYKTWTFEYTCDNGEVKLIDQGISPWDVTFDMCVKNTCGCGLKFVKENIIPYYYSQCA